MPWSDAAAPVWRRKRTLVILNGYVDESEDDSVFVLAGYVAPAEMWAKFSDAWKAALAEEPAISILKTKHAMSSPPRGDFWGLTAEQRDAKLCKLYEIIDAHVSFSVSVVVHTESRKRIFSKGPFSKEATNPFFGAFSALIGNVARMTIAHGMTEKIDWVFDDRMDKTKLLREWDDVIQKVGKDVSHVLGSTPIFKSDDDVLPLQAADMEAWWLRRRWSEKLKGLPRLEYPWIPSSIPEIWVVFDEAENQKSYDKVLKAATDMIAKGKT
jgi:hypothetical protein